MELYYNRQSGKKQSVTICTFKEIFRARTCLIEKLVAGLTLYELKNL